MIEEEECAVMDLLDGTGGDEEECAVMDLLDGTGGDEEACHLDISKKSLQSLRQKSSGSNAKRVNFNWKLLALADAKALGSVLKGQSWWKGEPTPRRLEVCECVFEECDRFFETLLDATRDQRTCLLDLSWSSRERDFGEDRWGKHLHLEGSHGRAQPSVQTVANLFASQKDTLLRALLGSCDRDALQTVVRSCPKLTELTVWSHDNSVQLLERLRGAAPFSASLERLNLFFDWEYFCWLDEMPLPDFCVHLADLLAGSGVVCVEGICYYGDDDEGYVRMDSFPALANFLKSQRQHLNTLLNACRKKCRNKLAWRNPQAWKRVDCSLFV